MQEALTAARDSGSAGSAEVAIRYRDDDVVVEVADDGAQHGRRLLGMRERVAVYGGELTTAGSPAGGWRVAARLPLEAGAVKRRLRDVPAPAWDVLIALVLGVAGAVEVIATDDVPGPAWANFCGVLLISASVAVRSVQPLGAAVGWLATIAGMVAFGASPVSFSSPFLSLFLLPYAAASRARAAPRARRARDDVGRRRRRLARR